MRCKDCRIEIEGDDLCFSTKDGYKKARDIKALEEVEHIILCVDCQERLDEGE